MSVTPDIKYPNTISPGGYDIPVTSMGRRRKFGGLWHITPDYLSTHNFNKSNYYDKDHYLQVDFNYLNGRLVVRLWVEDITYPATPDPIVLENHVHVQILSYDGNNYTDFGQSGSDPSDYNIIINQTFHGTLQLVMMYGIKICFTTYYQSSLEDTSADYIRLQCYTPALSLTGGDDLVSFNNVVDGAFLYSLPYSGLITYDVFFSDQGLGYGVSTGHGNFVDHHIGYYQINNLSTWAGFFAATASDIEVGPPSPAPPAGDDDTSGPGGGGGDYDPSSDPIDFPGLPTGGAFASGAIKAFKVTEGTILNIFTRLWDASLFDLDNFQKLLESPIDAIISLQAVPVSPTVANDELIKLGGYNTTEYGKRIPSQYITVDCGSINVTEFWGSALDYAPYTNIEIYLPFIGIKPLKIEDCMRKTLQVKYNIDISTGALVANIKCGQSVLYKFNGSFMNQIPVTSRVYDAIEQLVKGAAQVGTAAIMGNAPGAVAATISTAVNVALSKAQVTRAGDLSGIPGVLDDFVPYLIIHRPAQSLANNFKGFKGYPSNITATLGSLNGYTEVEYIHLTGIDGATDTELAEIENLLKNGVII